MLLSLSADSVIKTNSYEDYLYKLLLLLQEYEQSIEINPNNLSNVNSAENHDDQRFESEISIPCSLNLSQIDSFFYLPITSFTNGTETNKDLYGLNLFQSLFTVILLLGEKEKEISGSGSNRFNWNIERNIEKSQNNSIFSASISLDLESELINYNGVTIKMSNAKELFV
jgi:hypothetical protein